MNDTRKVNGNIVSALLGAGLILLGFLFLVGRYLGIVLDIDFGHYAWPFFIIVPGIVLFVTSFALERQAGIGLAIFGGMVTAAGTILLVMNAFDLYASWAYAWALIAPTSVGVAKLVYGGLRGMGDQVSSGLRLTGIGLVLFILGGAFFELVIGLHGFHFAAAWLCWPVLLIGLGVVLLIANLLPRRSRPEA